jgi:hypothetical protein
LRPTALPKCATQQRPSADESCVDQIESG